MAPRILFENALEDLRISLEEMGEHVEKLYDRMFLALKEGDTEAVHSIRKEDRVINDMERRIEAKCLALITKQQPVARDLRVISAALKIVNDLERIGDQVSDIGELALRFDRLDIFQYSPHLSAMADAAREQVEAAVDCFLSRDMENAQRVIAGDDLIDDLFNRVKNDVIDFLRKGAFPNDECIDIMMIAKYLEKIGDHAATIAEWECFQETGNLRNTRLL